MRTPLRDSLILLLAIGGASCGTDLTTVRANDNRTPAGTMRGDTLRLRMVVAKAEWYPGASDGSHISVTAFAEEGRAPQISGPLIRVSEGTVIDVTLRNGLADSTIRIVGLAHAPSASDSTAVLAPGETRQLHFVAGAPGTYLYRAIVGVPDQNVERETSSGAFVVDPVGGSLPDRIFVMNIWGDPADSGTYREALAINGRSFPHNEWTTETFGDSVRWRWINASVREHPMHLHGFYFRIDGQGGRVRRHHARTGGAAQGRAVGSEAQFDFQRAAGSSRLDAERLNEAFFLEDGQHADLQLRGRHLDRLLAHRIRVAQIRQEVGDGVGHHGVLVPSNVQGGCGARSAHQEAFRMPGISPSSARMRRQMRQMPNFL